MNRDTPRLAYDVYFAAPADRVWRAITDGAQTEQYFYGTRVDSSWEKGAPLAYRAGTVVMVEGEVVDVERGKKVVVRQKSMWDDKVAKDAASTVTWEVTPVGGETTKLSLVHDGFAGTTETYRQSADGWPVVLSSMKTLIETGRPLAMPPAA